MATYTIHVPGWLPTPLNKLMRGRWASSKHKAKDREVLDRAVYCHAVPKAAGKRKVMLHVVMPPGRRAPDPDSLFKSLLDGLVHLELLKDDNRLWCEPGPVSFSRGDALCTFLTLEDLP